MAIARMRRVYAAPNAPSGSRRRCLGTSFQVERYGVDHEQIDLGDPCGLITQEGPPTCDRGRGVLAMYRPNLDSLTSVPSINSAPWLLGAPQSGFSRLIRWINSRASWTIPGPATVPPRLPTPIRSKPSSIPAEQSFRLDDSDRIEQRRKQAVHTDQDGPIEVSQPGPPSSCGSAPAAVGVRPALASPPRARCEPQMPNSGRSGEPSFEAGVLAYYRASPFRRN